MNPSSGHIPRPAKQRTSGLVLQASAGPNRAKRRAVAAEARRAAKARRRAAKLAKAAGGES